MPADNNMLVKVVLLGWFPAVWVFFMLLPPRRAMLAALLVAWLFLPVAQFHVERLPDITKANVSSLAVLLGVLLFDGHSLLTYRPRWFDIPAAVACAAPVPSSIVNGLGLYDGLSGAAGMVLLWGIPYFLGRLYFTDLAGLRELAIAMFLAGLLYVPFCLYEVRMSPQLHYMVYGFHQHDFAQHVRFGGWRPKVFMDHGLMVGMFMTSAALCGFWLWRTRSFTEFLGFPLWLLLPPVVVTALLVKSMGSVLLMTAGFCSLLFIQYARRSLPILVLAAVPLVYIPLRTVFMWEAEPLVAVAISVAGTERAQSLACRIENEQAMSRHVRERALFGWGGWDRARTKVEGTRELTITDSLWIILWGNYGYVGLASIIAMTLLPPLMLRYRVPPRLWMTPKIGPAAVIALIVTLWMNDNLLNAMISPLYPLMAGALAGVKRVMMLHPVAASGAHAGQARIPARQTAPPSR